MARTKATVRKLLVKTRYLPGWLVKRECNTKKDNLPIQDKTDITRRKDCIHQKERKNNKSNQCKAQIFRVEID